MPAVDGPTALKIFRTRPDDFTVALLDVTMPSISGIQLTDELRKIRPDIPIILISGYSDEAVKSKLAGRGFSEFVQKPFGRESLLAALSSLN